MLLRSRSSTLVRGLLLSCTLLLITAEAAAVSTPGGESTSTTDDSSSNASTSDESTTTTTAVDSSDSTSNGDTTTTTNSDSSGGSSNSDSTTTTDSSGGSSNSDSTTTTNDSSGGSNTGESTTTTNDSSGGSSNSDSTTTTNDSNGSSNTSDSTTTTNDSSGGSSTGESTTTTGQSGGSDSTDSSTTEGSNSTSENSTTTTAGSSGNDTTEAGGNSTTTTTDESGGNSSATTTEPTTEESGGNSSSTTDGSGSSNSSTTEGSTGDSTSTTGSGDNSSNSNSSSSGAGSGSGGNGTAAGDGSSSSAAGEGSAHNVSTNNVFLQPGDGKNNVDITTSAMGEYFACGGGNTRENVRLVMRYDRKVSKSEVEAYVDSTSEKYKAEETTVSEMPGSYQSDGVEITLVDVFSVSLSRKVADDIVEFEVSCKVKTQNEADSVAANLTSTYSSWLNKRFSKACDMRENRVVPITIKFTEEEYAIAMRDRSSEEFKRMVASVEPNLLKRLQFHVSAVEKVIVLSVSNGTVVVETAVLVDDSATDTSTKNIKSTAQEFTSLDEKPIKIIETKQTEEYVAVMDTVNTICTCNATDDPEDTNLKDDKVPPITTEAPGHTTTYKSNGYFLNVTVPSFLALILLIAIFLFCTVNSNSCLCQLCASNVKKEVKLV